MDARGTGLAPDDPAGLRGAGGPPAGLWHREFRLFFAARAAGRLGDGMFPVALSAGLVVAGHGALTVSFALGAWTACFGGLVPLGGVLADRFSPRRMMVAADALRLVALSLLAAAFADGAPRPWVVYALSAASGVGAAMFQPGIASTIPAIVADVQRANAAIRVAESLAVVAGPAVAGLLVGLGGTTALLACNAASFGASALCLNRMRVGPPARGRTASLAAELADGWREFRARTWLWGVIAIWTGYSVAVLGPMVPLQAVLLTDSHGATAYGLATAVFGAGNVAGGLLAARTRPARPLAAGGCALLGVSAHVAALGAGAPLPVLGAAFLAGGLGLAFWVVMWQTSLQTQVPPAALNRVHAYDVAGSVLGLAAGRALAGPAAQWLTARSVLLTAAALNLAVVAALLAIPAVRRLPRADDRP